MATIVESRVVYTAGLVQGIVLVTFPAASTIFTDPDYYDLSATEYGALFLPQVVTAIAGSLLGATLSRRMGRRNVYLLGLTASLIAMSLLVVSQFVTDEASLAYALLLTATAFVGAGFGLTVPSLNTFAAAFHPDTTDRSVLVLNALLGLGTALAPVFVAAFVGLGFWWGLPVLSAVLLAGLLLVSGRLPLRTGERTDAPPTRSHLPPRYWLFAAFAALYGICETMNGNWAQADMTGELGGSTTQAALALTTFWAMVTIGRVAFAWLQRWLPTHRTYHLLPWLLAGALASIAVLPSDSPWLGVLVFGVAGLGCSALLPLTISFGQEDLAAVSASVAGGVIAFYQLGYGIAAFGAGPLQSSGVELSTIFGLAALAAVVMGALSFVIARPATAPAALHPRPTP
jgi:MFS family permease